MQSTTRWKECKNKDIDDVIQRINKAEKSFCKHRINDGNKRYFNFKFDITKKLNLKINNKMYDYVVASFSYEVSSITTRSYNIEVVIYQEKTVSTSDVYYVINRSRTEGLPILRRIMGYEGRLEIINSDLGMDGNTFFLWLIKKYYSDKGVVVFKNNELCTLNDVIEVKGRTMLSNILKTSGNKVLRLKTALSLILESNNLDEIILSITYLSHIKIDLQLKDSMSLGMDLQTYDGSFTSTNLIAKLSILLYEDLMPKLIESYRNDVYSKKWDLNEQTQFLDKVEDDLIEGLNQAKNNLKKSLNPIG